MGRVEAVVGRSRECVRYVRRTLLEPAGEGVVVPWEKGESRDGREQCNKQGRTVERAQLTQEAQLRRRTRTQESVVEIGLSLEIESHTLNQVKK